MTVGKVAHVHVIGTILAKIEHVALLEAATKMGWKQLEKSYLYT